MAMYLIENGSFYFIIANDNWKIKSWICPTFIFFNDEILFVEEYTLISDCGSSVF